MIRTSKRGDTLKGPKTKAITIARAFGANGRRFDAKKALGIWRDGKFMRRRDAISAVALYSDENHNTVSDREFTEYERTRN